MKTGEAKNRQIFYKEYYIDANESLSRFEDKKEDKKMKRKIEDQNIWQWHHREEEVETEKWVGGEGE